MIISKSCKHSPGLFLAVLTLFVSFAQAGALAPDQPPVIERIEPETIRFGKNSRVDITLSDQAQSPSQVFLSPGGPFVYALKQTLADVSGTPVSAVNLGKDLLVVTSDGQLHRVANSPGKTSVLESRTMENGAGKLFDGDRHTFLQTSDNSLYLIDNETLAIQNLLELDHEIVSLDSDSEYLYLLTRNNLLSIYAIAPDSRARLVQQIQLDQAAAAVAANGNHVYLATDIGIQILHTSNPGQWKPSRLFATSGQPRDMVVRNGLLYLADADKGVTILDPGQGSTHPPGIHLLGSLNKLGNVHAISAGQYRLLAATSDNQLHLVDTSNPARPVLLSSIRLNTRIDSILLNGETALVSHPQSIALVDFSSETMPPVSTEGVTLGGSRRGQVQDDYLYVADWFSGLHIYDVSEPSNIRHVSNFHTDGSSKGVLLHDGYAFVGDDDHGLQIIDVRDPVSPQRIAQLPTTGLAYTMKRVGNLLYLADHSGGLHIIDISNVRQPRRVAVYDTPGKAWAVDVLHNHAYVADDNTGLLVFDISNPSKPVPVAQYTPGGFAEDIKIRGNLAYVTFFDMGLHILDISTPQTPRLVSRLAIPGNARGIEFDDDYALVSAWYAGLQIVDITDPSKPAIIGHYDTDGATWGTVKHGHHVYALDWWDGIKAINIQDRQRPQRVARYQARETIVDLAIKGNYIYTSNHTAGLQVHDIRNPLNPMWVTGLELPGMSKRLAISGNLLLVELGNSIAIIDIRDPFRPSLMQTMTNASNIAGVTDNGGVVLVNQDGDLVLFQVDGQQLQQSALLSFPWCHRFNIHQQQLVCANDEGEVYIYDLYQYGAVLQKKFDLGFKADLIRSNQHYHVFYSTTNGNMQIISNHAPYRSLINTQLEPGVSEVGLSGNSLYITRSEHGLQTYHIAGNSLMRGAYYRSTQRITRFTRKNNQLFFAGGKRLSSMDLLPEIQQLEIQDKRISFTVPSTMPLGSYNLHLVYPQRQDAVVTNRLSVAFPKFRKPHNPK